MDRRSAAATASQVAAGLRPRLRVSKLQAPLRNWFPGVPCCFLWLRGKRVMRKVSCVSEVKFPPKVELPPVSMDKLASISPVHTIEILRMGAEGTRISLDVTPDTPLWEIQNHIHQQLNIPHPYVHLYWGDCEVDGPTLGKAAHAESLNLVVYHPHASRAAQAADDLASSELSRRIHAIETLGDCGSAAITDILRLIELAREERALASKVQNALANIFMDMSTITAMAKEDNIYTLFKVLDTLEANETLIAGLALNAIAALLKLLEREGAHHAATFYNHVCRYLDSTSAEYQHGFCAVLRAVGALKELAAASHHRCSQLREEALKELYAMLSQGDLDLVSPLAPQIGALLNDDDYLIRKAAAEVAQAIVDAVLKSPTPSRYTDALLGLFREGNRSAQKAAAGALVQAGAAARLAGCLEDRRPVVRVHACQWLARAGEGAAPCVPDLYNLLEDEGKCYIQGVGCFTVKSAAWDAIQALAAAGVDVGEAFDRRVKQRTA